MEKILFNRPRLRQNKALGQRFFSDNNFLHTYVEQSFLDRLLCFPNSFSRLLILGNVSPSFLENLQKKHPSSSITQAHCAPIMSLPDCFCEDEALPFSNQSFDLVISSLTFHLFNAPQKVLQEVRRVLSPGGLFLSSFLGGHTLVELRSLLLELELDLTGGACQRVAPMIDAQTGAALLQQAAFQEPITESDTLTASFATLSRLRLFLKSLGEQAPFFKNSPPLPKKLATCLEKEYLSRHPSKDAGLLSTFEIISYTGWAP